MSGVEKRKVSDTFLSNRYSGYFANESDWVAFLQCWHDGALRKHQELIGRTPDLPLRTLTRPPGRTSLFPVTKTTEPRDLQMVEAKVGAALPRSYVDFAKVYQPTLFPAIIPGTEIHARGFLPLEQVDLLERRRPDIVNIEESYSTDSEDSRYFVYGTKQDDVAVRTKYYRKAIVVGIYSQHELLLLNPAVTTKDAEMEAILLLHSSTFRAPSFAELLRQLSLAETTHQRHVPPYPQEALRGSCAEKLPLKNIWWE